MRRRDALTWGAALALVSPQRAGAKAPPPAAASLDDWQLSFDATAGELHARNRQGVLLKRLPATRLDGSHRASAAEVHALARRRSFVVAFDNLPELWELSTDPEAAPVFDGLVHDYRMGEGLGQPGLLAARRTTLPQPVQDLGFDAERALVVCRERTAPRPGAVRVLVVQLDVRRVIKVVVVEGDPDTTTAAVSLEDGRRLLRIERRDGRDALLIDPLKP
jgi:hypothetical protein